MANSNQHDHLFNLKYSREDGIDLELGTEWDGLDVSDSDKMQVVGQILLNIAGRLLGSEVVTDVDEEASEG